MSSPNLYPVLDRIAQALGGIESHLGDLIEAGATVAPEILTEGPQDLTPQQLSNSRHGAIVLDEAGNAWQLHAAGVWTSTTGERARHWSQLFSEFGPVALVYTP